MIVESIHVRGFLSHDDSRVDFSDSRLWLICGDNGAGKSALLDGAEYALYGRHRGNKQNADLLVKHGASRASIEVIIELDAERLKVQQTIDARRGNLGGRVDRWDEIASKWQPVNVGDGVDAVWGWLARRLPSHDLFRSGVYLRQGETARFLSGGTSDRIKRFGALIDLSPYTQAAARADVHVADAHGRKRDAETKLHDLGDISTEGLEQARKKRDDARDAHAKAAEDVSAAVKVSVGAREWAGLLEHQTNLNTEKGEIETILADAEAIRTADQYVRAWDAAAVDLASYWQACADAARLLGESREATKKSEEARVEWDKRAPALERARERLEQLNRDDRPAARALQRAEESRLSDLELEVRIASTRVRMAEVESQIEQLQGKDVELAGWQNRERALPALRAIAGARTELGDACRDVEEAKTTLTEAESTLTAANLVHGEALARASEAGDAWETLRATRIQLAAEIARLEGRMASHERLAGDEPECPVCAQPLDKRSHAHVQDILADEQSELKKLRAQQEQADADVIDATKKLSTAREDVAVAQGQVSEAERSVAGSRQHLAFAESRVERARKAIDDASQPLVRDHPEHADRLANIDSTWIAKETARVRDGLVKARTGAQDLQRAQEDAGKLQASLITLCDQRREPAEPLGDQLDCESLNGRIRDASWNVERAKTEVAKLESEAERLAKSIQAMAVDVGRLEAIATAASDLATDRAKQSVESENKANEIREMLGVDWTDVLNSRQEYDRARKDLPMWRARASRLTELDQALGKLERVQAQMQNLAIRMGETDPSHRIPIPQAEERELEARTAEGEARVACARADDELTDLEERQRNGETYREIIESSADEAGTYTELADLLKEGGPVQVWIAEHEQQRLVDEANAVLAKLSDPLRLVLGQPRRKQENPGLRDVLVVDTSDPLGKSRYFEFLSGGEQFRIALSLALALHRSASGGTPGTIFVDEGFGALDGHRRDALAHQLTDSSQGILQLGLAHDVIICSHSAEVQRHFPYRWLVIKNGGSAAVRRHTADDVAAGSLL